MKEYLNQLVLIANTLIWAPWRGYVYAKLWLWFVCPLGVYPIGKAHALGLAVLVGLATVNWRFGQKDDPFVNRLAESILLSSLVPALCLGFGAFYHHFMQ